MYKSNNVYSSICWEYPLQTKVSTQKKKKASKEYKKSYEDVQKKTSVMSAYVYYGTIILFFAGLLFFITVSISKAAIAEPKSTSNIFEIPVRQFHSPYRLQQTQRRSS